MQSTVGAKSESLDQLAFDLKEDTKIAQAAEAQHDATGPDDDDAAQSEMPARRQHSRAPLSFLTNSSISQVFRFTLGDPSRMAVDPALTTNFGRLPGAEG